MRNIILAGAAALAFTAAPTFAQEVGVDADGDVYVMTDSQQTMYDGWPMDRRTAYDGWPMDIQEYYWTLDETQARGWWALNDEQRVRVYNMTPQQRTAAWTQIAAQMGGNNTSATARTAASSTGQGNMRFVSNEVVQTTPADSGPPSGDVPICTPNQQDNCINAWEAGKRGPGVAKPLGYWPGKPASEMD